MTGSTLTSFSLTSEEKEYLLKSAKKSIKHGVDFGKPSPTSEDDYFGVLGEKGASFVTLMIDKKLRGCIGYLVAKRLLAIDVIENAYSSAFNDTRFSPLLPEELPHLEIKISVLSPSFPLRYESEEDLIRQLHPGIDGLILSTDTHHGTFLPSVWEELTDPKSFLKHLKQKAGLPSNFWSDEIEIRCYTTVEFGDKNV